MTSPHPSRTAARRAALSALAFACVLAFSAPLHAAQPGAAAKVAPRPAAGPKAPKNNAQQEHLAQWMDRHRSLPLADQQTALEREPGFRDLPAQTQQRMRDRLTQLNNMPPEQRRRLLERTEAMEKLDPQQRQQVRGALQQLNSLPIDRRRLVAHAFRDLRELPVPQRQAVLTSDRFQGQFSGTERGTLSSLLAVEPYLPVQRPSETNEGGK